MVELERRELRLCRRKAGTQDFSERNGGRWIGRRRQRSVETTELPAISIGDKKVSRLIAGGNPMRGFSHSSRKLSRHMVEYFTAKRITEFLLNCEAEGITTFQSSYSKTVREGILGAWERGSKIQSICLTSPRHAEMKDILELKPIAIVHHGSVTDPAFRSGRAGEGP